MKPSVKYTYTMIMSVFLCGFNFFAAPVWAQDIRLVPMEAEKIEAAMKQKASQELRTAQEAACRNQARNHSGQGSCWTGSLLV